MKLLKWASFALLLHAASYAVPTPSPAVEIPDVIRATTDALRPQPLYRFTSDGCSGFLSVIWRVVFREAPPFEYCCVCHDVRYWQGGSAAQRRAADAGLLQCVDQAGYPLLAWVMWAGVRLHGGPEFPTSYRWAYGEVYFTGYTEERP